MQPQLQVSPGSWSSQQFPHTVSVFLRRVTAEQCSHSSEPFATCWTQGWGSPQFQASLSRRPVLCAKGLRCLCEHGGSPAVSCQQRSLNNVSRGTRQPYCHCLLADLAVCSERRECQKVPQEQGEDGKSYRHDVVFKEQTREGCMWCGYHLLVTEA